MGGKTFISVVGFLFQDAKIGGISFPFHRNFEEVNLRFYVKRFSNNEWCRAVVFIKEFVPRWAIAWTARTFYNENYLSVPMSHLVLADENGSFKGVSYEWILEGKRNCLELIVDGQPGRPREGSHEEFISEHYWGYARQRDGGTLEYQVKHPKWQIWPAQKFRFDCDVRSHYGEEFVRYLESAPASAFLAEGSEVTVLKGMRVS